jgi:hypothetical protein
MIIALICSYYPTKEIRKRQAHNTILSDILISRHPSRMPDVAHYALSQGLVVTRLYESLVLATSELARCFRIYTGLVEAATNCR